MRPFILSLRKPIACLLVLFTMGLTPNMATAMGGHPPINDGGHCPDEPTPGECKDTYSIQNAYSAQGGDFGLYLEGLGDGHWCGYYYRFTSGELIESDDGTAKLTGTIESSCDAERTFNVKLKLSGKTNTPPAGSPVDAPSDADLSQWHYYPRFSGTLRSNQGAYNGMIIKIKKDGSAFQIGEGASNGHDTQTTLSGAGQLTWKMIQGAHYQCPTNRHGSGNMVIRLTQTNDCSPIPSDALDIRKHLKGDDERTVIRGQGTEFDIVVTNTSDQILYDIAVEDDLVPTCNTVIPVLEPNQTYSFVCEVSDAAELFDELRNSPTQLEKDVTKQWRDTFSSRRYDNNDGDAEFSTSWVETDVRGGGARYGLVKIHHKRLYLKKHWYKTGTIERTVDLSDLNTATLDFKWKGHSWWFDDALSLEISTDNGSSFNEIATFKKQHHYTNSSIDLSAYTGQTVTLRFVPQGFKHTVIAIDNVEIAGEGRIIEDINIKGLDENGFTNTACASVTSDGETQTTCDSSSIIIEDESPRELLCERIVTNSTPFDGGMPYAVWMGNHQDSDLDNWFFNAGSNILMREYSDGTAEILGSIYSFSGLYSYPLNIQLSGYTTTPPENSPRIHRDPSVVTRNWAYYTTMSGRIGGFDIVNTDIAFQIGYGGNLNDTGFGIAGFFNYGDDRELGDINATVSEQCTNH